MVAPVVAPPTPQHPTQRHAHVPAGRLAFREAINKPDVFEFVQLNDLASVESTAYLFKWDSVHGESFILSVCGMRAAPLRGVASGTHAHAQWEYMYR